MSWMWWLPWLPWLVGLAVLALVVAASVRVSEAQSFAALLGQAQPAWLGLALALQAATYLAQAQVWRTVLQVGGQPLPVRTAYRLSLVKLVVDQALPSSGLSGSVAIGGALQRRGVPVALATAAVVVSAASYVAAYALAVMAALLTMALSGHARPALVVPGMAFVLAAALASVLVLRAEGHGAASTRPRVGRWPVLQQATAALARADAGLVRNPRVVGFCVALQFGIVLLDALTLWALVRALGAKPAPAIVFASFMLSTVLRTLSVVPAGLGAFEGASVLTLHALGVPVPVALSATLLFRGLSFWLPIIPGALLARGLLHSGGNRGGNRDGNRGGNANATAPEPPPAYWHLDASAVLEALRSQPQGLTSAEAQHRLDLYGPNTVTEESRTLAWRLLAAQFRSPLVLILLIGASVSLVLRDWTEAAIILAIVLGSGLLGFSQEYRAGTAIDALRRRLGLKARALRDGAECTLASSALVPGDVVLLSAGNLVPADGLVLEARDFLVSEASLTGESFPVEKRATPVPETAPLTRRTNCVYLGTSVRSGTARVLVVSTGRATAFGAIAAKIAERPPDSDFARAVRHFGQMLLRTMLLMVLLVVGANLVMGQLALESLLFAVALAVGLTPELLPAIVSVTLSRGAREMAARGVIVRRLEAIENLGSMDVLCTDKTGTLTEGSITLERAVDLEGRESPEVLRLAFFNASLETGIANPIDAAIVAAGRAAGLDKVPVRKVDEIPYDFTRKRLTIVVDADADVDAEGGDVALPHEHLIVTKGAFANVLAVCDIDEGERARWQTAYDRMSAEGLRVLALATRRVPARPRYERADESGLTPAGFVCFLDPPKAAAAGTLRELAELGVRAKVISGDNRYTVAHVARQIGLDARAMLTGEQLAALKDEALWSLAPRTTLFVEVDPQQKERIIRALQRTGHSVGYLGDGINDAPALHAADVGISVEGAVDVARDSADVVLLERDLAVLRRGVEDGRATFANTLKYIGITTSANFGNMISMSLATPLLPFLPLLAKQILLNNFISDLPSAAISTDRVDPEPLREAQRLDVAQIRRYMMVFGLTSTCFDLLAFFVLLKAFGANAALFQTAWFVISLLTELSVVLVLRTRGPAWRSRPSPLLLWATLAAGLGAIMLPYSGRLATLFGFVALPWPVLACALGITLLYVLSTEAVKRGFYASRFSRVADRR